MIGRIIGYFFIILLIAYLGQKNKNDKNIRGKDAEILSYNNQG